MNENQIQYRELANYSVYIDAEITNNFLLSSGIDSIIYSTNNSAIPTIGNFTILVNSEQYDEAVELLNGITNAPTTNDEQGLWEI